MGLTVFEEVLYGRLRPWRDTDGIEKQWSVNRPLSEQSKPCYKVILSLLEFYPELVRKLTNDQSFKVEDYRDISSYVEIGFGKPKNRKTAWYYRLLMLEGKRYLQETVSVVRGLEADIDRQYELHVRLQELIDILKEAHQKLRQLEEQTETYIINLLHQLCIQLIIDFGLRFPTLKESDTLDEETLWTTILNNPQPASLVSEPTISYRQHRLEEVLAEQTISEELIAEHHQLISKIKERTPSELALTPYLTLLYHLENAAFLIAMDASFIADYPSKLLDANHCREWLTGTEKDFIRAESPQKAEATLQQLARAKEKFNRSFLHTHTGHLPDIPLSKAARLVHAIAEIEQQKFNTLTERKQNRHTDLKGLDTKNHLDFQASFKRRFISFNELYQVLPASEKTVNRYIEKGEIRVLEFSSYVKFLYREDVEAFIEEQTKG